MGHSYHPASKKWLSWDSTHFLGRFCPHHRADSVEKENAKPRTLNIVTGLPSLDMRTHSDPSLVSKVRIPSQALPKSLNWHLTPPVCGTEQAIGGTLTGERQDVGETGHTAETLQSQRRRVSPTTVDPCCPICDRTNPPKSPQPHPGVSDARTLREGVCSEELQ